MNAMAPVPAAATTTIMAANTIDEATEEFTTGVKMSWMDTGDGIRPGFYGINFVILITGGANDDMTCKMYPCQEGVITLGTVAVPGRDNAEKDSFVIDCSTVDPYQQSYFVPWDLAPAGLCLGFLATGATDTLIVTVTYQGYRIGNPATR